MSAQIGVALALVWECPWCHFRNPRANAGEDHCWNCGAIVLTVRADDFFSILRVERTAAPSPICPICYQPVLVEGNVHFDCSISGQNSEASKGGFSYDKVAKKITK